MGKVIELLGKNGSTGEEITPDSLELGQRVSYGNRAAARKIYTVVEEEGGPYGQRVIAADGSESTCSEASLNAAGGWEREEGKADTNEILDLINKADAKKNAQQIEAKAKREAKEQLKEKGEKMFNKMKPNWAEAAIIAELHEDKSDSMTDYFAHNTKRRVLLAWSKHTRNLFPEMRKAASNWHKTKHLAAANDDFEHRENYSGGAGYYLKDGHSHRDGWAIKKISLDWSGHLDKIYMMLGSDDYTAAVDIEEQETEDTGDVYIERYSEKAGVVRGDTKPIKEKLKDLNCRFNPRLKDGPGWIFPITRKDEIKEGLNL